MTSGLRDAPPRRTAVARAARAADRRGRVGRRVAVPARLARSRSAGRRAWAFRVSFTGELGWELLVPTEFVGRPVRADRRRRRGSRAAPGRVVRVRGDPRSSAASGRGVTTSARSTSRSRPGSGSRSRAGRRSTSSGARPSKRFRAVAEPRAAAGLGPRARRRALARRVDAPRRRARRPRDERRRSRRPCGGSVGLAWVHGPLDGDWCVEIGGDPVPCRVSLDPFYDPRGERLRS